MNDPLTERVGFALTPDDRDLIEEAARRERRKLSEWLRIIALKAAVDVVTGGKSVANQN